MIKFYYTAMIAAFLAFCTSGCQKDAVDTVPAYLQNTALNGKWYLKKLAVQTNVDTSLNIKTDSIKSFTTDDYFEFNSDNSATYSSTIIGKKYNGYYSANSSATPKNLTFKSGDYVSKFNISKISKDTLIIYQNQSTTATLVTTTVSDYYIYTH